MQISHKIRNGLVTAAVACLVVSSSFAASTPDAPHVTSTTDGVTYGVDIQYTDPQPKRLFLDSRTIAISCTGMLLIAGIAFFAYHTEEKRKKAEQYFQEDVHRDAVHRIIDTNKEYRAYIERADKTGYNLVVVGNNGCWSGNFPSEDDARRFAYENNIELD